MRVFDLFSTVQVLIIALFHRLDDTNLAYLCSEEMRQGAIARGEDVQKLPKEYVKLINAVRFCCLR